MIEIRIGGDTYARVSTEFAPFASTPDERLHGLINQALNQAGVPHTDASVAWTHEVVDDAIAHNLHPFTCYGRVSIHDPDSPQTHGDWLRARQD